MRIGRLLPAMFIALTLVSGIAKAQQRVFVSAATGNDANACSVTAPCRSFSRAMTVVSLGGEILALDSGGFGPVSVASSVSIVAPLGVEGSITQGTAGQDAITINAPGANVVLRGLGLFGLGTGQDGIGVFAAATVSIQSCNISGFSGNGISVTVSNPAAISIIDTVASSNVSNGAYFIAGGNDYALFTIDHCRFLDNAFSGVNSFQGGHGTVHNTLTTGGLYGIVAQTVAPGQTATVTIEDCVVTRASIIGIGDAGDGSTGVEFMYVSNTLVTQNANGVSNFSDANAHILSRSDNTVIDNTANGAFTGTFSAQ